MSSRVRDLQHKLARKSLVALTVGLAVFSSTSVGAGSALAFTPTIDVGDPNPLGHQHSATDFELELQTAGRVKMGEILEVEVHITAKNGKKINMQYPTRLSIVGEEDWKLVNGSGKRLIADQEPPVRATLMGKVRATRVGIVPLQLKISFSVCTNEQCLMDKIVLADSIQVE